jgi:hypothetical protein
MSFIQIHSVQAAALWKFRMEPAATVDGSISLSPLYQNLTINLHVRIATSLQQSFPWLHPIQA